MDGLMLGFIARELSRKLSGARVDRVMQPEKDELHITYYGPEGAGRLLLCASPSCARAHCTQENKPNPQEPPMFCMLLRKQLAGARVQSVRQVGGDRILEIEFACVDELGEKVSRILSCEIMGKHSNIILRSGDGRITDAIRHVGVDVSRVREVKPGLPYTPPPSQEKVDPTAADVDTLREALLAGGARLDTALFGTLSGLGALSAKELAYRLTGQDTPHLSPEARSGLAEPLHRLLTEMPAFGPPVLLIDDGGEPIDALPFFYHSLDARRQKPIPDGPSMTLDHLYHLKDRQARMAQKSASLARSIKANIERRESRLAIHEQALADTDRLEENRILGELLTSNLHLVEKGAATAQVFDYYTGSIRVIPLDLRLTPAQNAQKYYKQYQKMRAAQAHAKEQAAQARDELALLLAHQDDLRKCGDAIELEEIRQELVKAGYVHAAHSRGKSKKPTPSKPLSCVSSDGLRIQVGKNSAQNDRLTGSAPPEALWLHAKNMAGSHVIVDCPGELPEATLREAALLAAWFSRGYASGQVPIDYTRRKYVKKPSGAAAGFVTYTNQKTLYITPDERTVKRLLGETFD